MTLMLPGVDTLPPEPLRQAALRAEWHEEEADALQAALDGLVAPDAERIPRARDGATVADHIPRPRL